MTDKMLTMSRRDAKLGPSISCRTQKQGDENGAKATDIALEGIHLSAVELCALLNNGNAYQRLYVLGEKGELPEVAFPQFGAIPLQGKIDHAVVTLYVGSREQEIKLGICKLARLRLTCNKGGSTELSCQVQATPTLDRRIAQLIESMAENVQVEIEYEHNAEQAELPIAADAEAEEGEEQDEKPTRARRTRKGRNGDRVGAH